MKLSYFTIIIILITLSGNALASDSSWGDEVIKKTRVNKGFTSFDDPTDTKEESYDADWFLNDKPAKRKKITKDKRKSIKRRSKVTKRKRKSKRKEAKRWETQGWH